MANVPSTDPGLPSPRDGDIVANCGHEHIRHMFRFPEPTDIACDDPECSGLATWYASCDDCKAEADRTGRLEIRDHASWIGDEPIKYGASA